MDILVKDFTKTINLCTFMQIEFLQKPHYNNRGGINMALIDYKCRECQNEFFEIVRSEDEKVVCPKCKSENIARVYKGKFYGKGEGCSGSCSGCSGCH